MSSEDDEGAPWSAVDSDPPAHRCGFELLPEDLDLGEEYDDLDEWRTDTASASCCREVWNDGRCRWHADAEPEVLREAVAERDERVQNLDGIVLRDVELDDSVSFTGCRLRAATFENVTAREADFADCNLSNAQFPGADLPNAQFPGAFLHQADLTRADARKADFTPDDDTDPTNLEDAVLRETDLRGADLSGTRLYQTDLTDARINRKTTFDDTTVYERNPELSGWFRDTTDAYGAAAWVHRRLERLHESAAASEEARRYHIRKQEAEQADNKRRALGLLREMLTGDGSDS